MCRFFPSVDSEFPSDQTGKCLILILNLFSVAVFLHTCHSILPAPASADEWQVSGSEVLARLLPLFNTSKGLCVGHGPDGWSLIDELFTLEEWIDRQATESQRRRGKRTKHVSALNLEAHVRTNCSLIHSLRACYRAHYLLGYSLP